MNEAENIVDWRWKAVTTIPPCSFLFFLTLSTLIKYFGTPAICATIPQRWKSYATSWSHALISGCFALYVVLTETEFMQDRPEAFYVHCFSVGYFVYDFFDMFLATENIGSWDMYLHHVVITFFVTYAYFECGCSGYGAWNYLCELSNVALHGRKLVTMLGHSKKSSLYKGMNHFYFFTFFVFRFGPQVLGLLKYLSEVIALRVSLLCAFLCIPNQVFLVWIGVDIAYRITLREFFPKEKKEDGGKLTRNGGGGGISGAKTLKTG